MNHEPPIIDMRPDGTFLPPPGRRPVVPMSTKLFLGAILVATVGTAIGVAALAIWVVSLVLPVVLVAAAVAWGVFKFRQWQGKPGPFGGSIRRQPLRPGSYPGRFGH